MSADDSLFLKILSFWQRYNEAAGVERTITIDECDRERVSRELAEHLQNLQTNNDNRADK